MFVRWLFAAIHVLALGIGLGAVWARALALQGPLEVPGVQRVLHADAWWGLAAFLWIGSGLVRLFAGLEKSTAYYFQNDVFWTKMALLALILILEVSPVVTFGRWRRLVRRGETVDTRAAGRLARISYVEAGLVALMVLAATAMARGHGAG